MDAPPEEYEYNALIEWVGRQWEREYLLEMDCYYSQATGFHDTCRKHYASVEVQQAWVDKIHRKVEEIDQ